jgi:predicted lysophospholipase L1 biosynthesis ABC-type transport system permease subunit
MALARRTRAGAVPVVATLAAAVLAVAVAVTALTFASSLDHLLKTPVLYGQTWDFDTAPFGPPFPPSVLREVRHDRGLRGVAVASVSPVQIGTRTVGARAVDDVKGSVEPVVREGRAPRRPGEVLLARKTLDALDAKIGDTVTLHNGSRAVRLRIVGRGVLPATKWNKLGEGAQFSFRSLQRVQPDAVANVLEARLAGGAAGAAGQRHLIRLFDENNAVGPSEVGDFGGVRNMPVLIAAVFAAAAAATLAHTLLVSIRRRRRDLAILKTLGFVRVQVMATVAWQATTIAAIGVLVGLPLGVAVGRFGWNVFADDLGVVPEPVTPVGLTLIVVPAAFLVANAIASLPGWTAARTQPALALRTE